MNSDSISEIGIDEGGRLYVCPSHMSFDFIYRAAMDVHWDKTARRLHSPVPRRWTYDQWFGQLILAAADEYGVRLSLTPETVWVNIPADLKARLQSARR